MGRHVLIGQIFLCENLLRCRVWSLLDEAALLEFEVEKLFECVGTLAVLAVGWVVLSAVGDDPLQVGDEQLLGDVIAVLQPLGHGLQVQRQQSYTRDPLHYKTGKDVNNKKN